MNRRDELWVDAMKNSWPKIVHAVEVENRLGDEVTIRLQSFAHGEKGEVLKLVITRKGDPTGLVLPNDAGLH